MRDEQLSIFALQSSRDFGERIAAAVGHPVDELEERVFSDGEHIARPLASVRDHDVFVIQSLHADDSQSVHDKLCGLLFLAAALKDASAARITAIVPYFCYARKDRHTRARDPVTNRYVANLIEGAGIARVVTIDVHDPVAYANAFRIPAEHLVGAREFAQHFARILPTGGVTVVSPDTGGIKRAGLFRDLLCQLRDAPVSETFLTKHRIAGAAVGEGLPVDSLRGQTAIIFDDLIATGETIRRAADACRAAGATRVLVAATHGLFSGDADTIVAESSIDQVVVTNTVPPFRLRSESARKKLTILDVAPMFAKAIRAMHESQPLHDQVDL